MCMPSSDILLKPHACWWLVECCPFFSSGPMHVQPRISLQSKVPMSCMWCKSRHHGRPPKWDVEETMIECFIIIFSAAVTVGLVPSKKTPGIIPNFSSCPADDLLSNWSCGHHTALDFSVISHLQHLTIFGAATTLGHALQICAQWKLPAHRPSCCSVGIEFIPMVVEIGWSTETISNIKNRRKLLVCALAPPVQRKQL